MYREYITRFILAGMVLVSSCVCARELKINRIAAKPAFQMEYLSESMTEDKRSFFERSLRFRPDKESWTTKYWSRR